MTSRRQLEDVRVVDSALAFTVAHEALPEPADCEVLVQVKLSLVDVGLLANHKGMGGAQAVFVGVVKEGAGTSMSEGDVVAGIGPVSDYVLIPASNLLHPNRTFDTELELAVLVFASAVAAAIPDIGISSGNSVFIKGQGLTAHLVRCILQRRGASVVGPSPLSSSEARSGAFDLVVDAEGDVSNLTEALLLVRPGGKAVLLLPAGQHVHPFDFYPNIHRRSLVFAARRVLQPNCVGSFSDHDRDFLHQMYQQERSELDAMIFQAPAPQSECINRVIPIQAPPFPAALALEW